jgi:hypothetical protein
VPRVENTQHVETINKMLRHDSCGIFHIVVW